MSRENVEIVKGFLPAPDVNIVPLVRDDEMWLALVDARSPFVHADYESANKGLPDGDKSYVGVDGERALWLDWLAPWVSYRVGAEEYIDLGERVLGHARPRPNRSELARAVWHTRGHRSGIEQDLRFSQVNTYREGRCVFVEYFLDHEQAVNALGA